MEEEYTRIFGDSPRVGKIFCPFHENSHTPAAKVYGNIIKCFGACGRSFSVYDLLRRYDPDRIVTLKSSMLLPDTAKASSKSIKVVPRSQLDLSLPIGVLVNKILHFYDTK